MKPCDKDIRQALHSHLETLPPGAIRTASRM